MTNEKLSLWDRLFNRFTKKIYKRGSDVFGNYSCGLLMGEYKRNYVEYIVTDRLTGSETIKKEYLD